jgi:hypothetical protein
VYDRPTMCATALGLIAAENDASETAPPDIGAREVVFVDEYSSAAWQGANNWERWLQARRRYETQYAISGRHDTVLAMKRIAVMGDRASAVLASSFAYEKDGRVLRQPGTEALTFHKIGEGWAVDGYARLSTGEIAQGEDADAALASAKALVRKLNIERVIPAMLVDSALIEDDLQDWPMAGPGGDKQDPRKAPLLKGDPDCRIVLGRPLRLVVGRSDDFVVFSATLTSIKDGHLKGRGRIGLTLGGIGAYYPLIPSPRGFEYIAWVPE